MNTSLNRILLLALLLTSSISDIYAADDADDLSLVAQRGKRSKGENSAALKRAKVESHFDSKIKAKIEGYIPQVFKVICTNDESGHTGTAWMYNAELGILATNHHVIPPDFGIYSIEDRSGNIFTKVKIFGVSPSTQYGDFGFIQVPALAGKFTQMPMESEHTVEMHDPVAFMGNSYGEFSVEEGNVNGLYDFSMTKVIESFCVQLMCRGGASGSPTFNRNGRVTGILYAGDDIHSIVHPIWFLQRAYNIMMSGSVPQPLSLKSFHSIFDTVKVHDVLKYHHISDLSEYLIDREKNRNSLLIFEGSYKTTKDSDAIEDGDILLMVNGEKIGCDTIKITKILDSLDENQKATLTIVRNGRIVEIQVKPENAVQSYSKRIYIDDMYVYSNSSSFYAAQFKKDAPVAGTEGESIYDLETTGELEGVIASVGQTEVKTFEEFLSVFHEEYVKKESNHMIFTIKKNKKKVAARHNIDLEALCRQEPRVTFFNQKELGWKKLLLSKYLEAKE